MSLVMLEYKFDGITIFHKFEMSQFQSDRRISKWCSGAAE